MDWSILWDVIKKPMNIILIILNIVNIAISIANQRFAWLTLILVALTALDFFLSYKNEKAQLAEIRRKREAKENGTQKTIAVGKINYGALPKSQEQREKEAMYKNKKGKKKK